MHYAFSLLKSCGPSNDIISFCLAFDSRSLLIPVIGPVTGVGRVLSYLQAAEAQLDIMLDQMRQDSTERGLNDKLTKALVMLDNLQSG